MESDVTVVVEPGTAEDLASQGNARTPAQLAIQDLREGLGRWWLWNAMAWQDILQRYRGSVLGPFWLTISMAIMISTLGVLYSTLFKINVSEYLPFLCLGILSWTLISTMVVESCTVFTSAEALIKQIRIPLSVHVYRMIWRNLIITAHNAVVYVAVLFIFGISLSWSVLLLLPGLLLVVLNGVWLALLLGMICARFRDIPQIVASLTQIVFFVTPIIWKPELLGRYELIAHLNPFMSFIDLLRAPLLGSQPHPLSWVVALAVTAAGCYASFAFFARFRARIPYWC